MQKSHHLLRRLLRACSKRPCDGRAADRGYQFPASDCNWRLPLLCEGCLVKGTIARRERAVFTFGGEPRRGSALAVMIRGIARALAARGIPTARGGAWTPVQVSDILLRDGGAAGGDVRAAVLTKAGTNASTG